MHKEIEDAEYFEVVEEWTPDWVKIFIDGKLISERRNLFGYLVPFCKEIVGT